MSIDASCTGTNIRNKLLLAVTATGIGAMMLWWNYTTTTFRSVGEYSAGHQITRIIMTPLIYGKKTVFYDSNGDGRTDLVDVEQKTVVHELLGMKSIKESYVRTESNKNDAIFVDGDAEFLRAGL